MLHEERPDGPVAAAQKCAIHGPLSVATRGGGCTAWSSMRRFDWRLSTRVESSRGGPAVRHRPSHGEEDADLLGAAGLPPDEAGQAAQAGRVHRHRRRDPGGGHGSGRAAQAASHGAPDIRAATGRARVHRRLYHREGLCPGPAAIDARGFCAAASPAGPCPGRLRRGGGGGRGQAGEGCLLLPDPAPFQRLVRQGLSEGDVDRRNSSTPMSTLKY